MFFRVSEEHSVTALIGIVGLWRSLGRDYRNSVRMSAKGDASYFLSLTNEVIDIIFSYDIIDYKDLCRCSQVCTKFYAVATSHQLWRKKALRRWDVIAVAVLSVLRMRCEVNAKSVTTIQAIRRES